MYNARDNVRSPIPAISFHRVSSFIVLSGTRGEIIYVVVVNRKYQETILRRIPKDPSLPPCRDGLVGIQRTLIRSSHPRGSERFIKIEDVKGG